MSDDPNKKQNQQEPGQQTDQQTDNLTQKRPTQGGHDVETDEKDDQNQGGQRRAS
jgi:hypothetical protein